MTRIRNDMNWERMEKYQPGKEGERIQWKKDGKE